MFVRNHPAEGCPPSKEHSTNPSSAFCVPFDLANALPSLGLCQERWVGTHTSHHYLFLLLAACVPHSSRAGRSRHHSLLPPEYKTLWFSLPCRAFGMPVDKRESRKSFLSKMPDFQVYGFAAKSCFEWQKLNIIFSFSLQFFHDTLKSLDK